MADLGTLDSSTTPNGGEITLTAGPDDVVVGSAFTQIDVYSANGGLYSHGVGTTPMLTFPATTWFTIWAADNMHISDRALRITGTNAEDLQWRGLRVEG